MSTRAGRPRPQWASCSAAGTRSGSVEHLLATLHTLRQQQEKSGEAPYEALADFVAPRTSGRRDHVGLFAVTAGHGLPELCARFEKDHDDYRSIMAKALADRLAEAFAECLHKRAREDWGFGKSEALSHEDLLRERYRGIRPAAGYPACPDHAVKGPLFDVLRGSDDESLRPSLIATQQAHRSVRFGNQLVLKVYRRTEEGSNPELEIGRFLTENHRVPCTAPLAGAIEYRRRGRHTRPDVRGTPPDPPKASESVLNRRIRARGQIIG